MIDDLTLHDGNGPSDKDRNRKIQWTRRAFGGLVLGGFLSAGIGFVNAAAAMALQRDAINGLVISVANLRDTILNAARPDSCR